MSRENKNARRHGHRWNASVRTPMRPGLLAPKVSRGVEQKITFETTDGWRIVGMLCIPTSDSDAPGVVLVHGSRHEADAYGQVSTPGLPQTLCEQGIATLRIEIRGRGASRGTLGYHSMTPAQRDAVRLDVEGAITFLGSQSGVKKRRIGIVAEQDTASASVLAGGRAAAGLILISGRLSESAKSVIEATDAPLLCLVSKEDRRGFRDMTDAYLLSRNKRSRLRLFEGLALGTTMFSTWRNEFPDKVPLEEEAGIWLAGILKS